MGSRSQACNLHNLRHIAVNLTNFYRCRASWFFGGSSALCCAFWPGKRGKWPTFKHDNNFAFHGNIVYLTPLCNWIPYNGNSRVVSSTKILSMTSEILSTPATRFKMFSSGTNKFMLSLPTLRDSLKGTILSFRKWMCKRGIWFSGLQMYESVFQSNGSFSLENFSIVGPATGAMATMILDISHATRLVMKPPFDISVT